MRKHEGKGEAGGEKEEVQGRGQRYREESGSIGGEK